MSREQMRRGLELFRIVLLTVLLAACGSGGGGAALDLEENSYQSAKPQEPVKQNRVIRRSSTDEVSNQQFMPVNGEYVPGEVLVKLKPAISAAWITSDEIRRGVKKEALKAGLSVSLKKSFKKIGVHHLKLEDNVQVEEAINKLKSSPDVEYAEPNYILHLNALPDDPDFAVQWGLHNTGQVINGSEGTAGADMMMSEAWDLQTGSNDVLIAVIDSGVDYNHPDLAANIWVNSGETCDDGIDNDANGYIDDCNGWDFVDNDNDPMDFEGHGTHVAGTIAAVGNNNEGVTGVSWNTKILPLRYLDMFGFGTVADEVVAIEYADAKGAAIINLSSGSNNFSWTEKDAIDNSMALVVCAAGNEGKNNDSSAPNYPSSYVSPNIIAVAATDKNDKLTSFSNFGVANVDVAAPGVEIYGVAPGRATIFSDNFDTGSIGLWTTGGSNNTWGITSAYCRSPNYSLTDSPGTNYLNYTNSWVKSPAIDLTGKQGCKLDYTSRWDIESSYDALYVGGSKDSSSWTILYGYGVEDIWSGTSDGNFIPWTDTLSPYEGQTSVYIRFRLESDWIVNYDGVYIDDVKVTCATELYNGEEYEFKSGTSMAAPHVAGLAGLIKAERSILSAVEIKNILISTVDTKSALSGKVASGGRINAYKALYSIAPPAAPTGLTAASVSSSQIDLTWADNSGNETGFKIERKTGAGGTYSQIAMTAANATSYSNTSLLEGTAYYYRLRATNGGTDSAYSAEANATTSASEDTTDGDTTDGDTTDGDTTDGDTTEPEPPVSSVQSSSGDFCFIATAAYGSYLNPQVRVLRDFRDKYLLTNGIGRSFVKLYYAYSPWAADFIKKHEILRAATRWILTPVIFFIKTARKPRAFKLGDEWLPGAKPVKLAERRILLA